jgi:hypothetical protein
MPLRWVLVTPTERTRSLGISHAQLRMARIVVVAGTAAGKVTPVETQTKTNSECGTMKGGSVHQLWQWVLVTLTERIRSRGISHASTKHFIPGVRITMCNATLKKFVRYQLTVKRNGQAVSVKR